MFTDSLRCYQHARTKKGPNEPRCEGEDVSLGTAHNMTGIKKQCKTQQWLTDEVLGLAGRRQGLKSKRHPDETGCKLSTQASDEGYERWLDETLQEFIHSERCRAWSNRTGEVDAKGLFSTVKEIGQMLRPGGSVIRTAYGKSGKKRKETNGGKKRQEYFKNLEDSPRARQSQHTHPQKNPGIRGGGFKLLFHQPCNRDFPAAKQR